MAKNIIEKTRDKLAKYEKRQAEIVEAAIFVFNTNGYAGATTAHIAKKAGVSERALYRHFKNKEAIYYECARTIIDNLIQLLRNELGDATEIGINYIEAFASSYVNFVKNNPDKSMFLVHLYTYRELSGVDEWIKNFISERLNEAKTAIDGMKEKGVIKSDTDSRVLAGVFIAQYFSIVFLNEFVEPELLTVETAIRLVKNYMQVD